MGAKGHQLDRNFSALFCCTSYCQPCKESVTFFQMYLRSHAFSVLTCWGRMPILVYPVSPGLYLKSISSLFLLPISTPSSNYKVLCLQDYLSIRGRMKCEKQSEKLQATIHNFNGCNYANDRSFSDLYPSACVDGGLPLWQPAFCFRALYNFVTAGDPALKCWGAHLFERQLDFLCCSFSFTLYSL